MNEPENQLDEPLRRLYRDNEGRETQVAQVMRRVAAEPMPRRSGARARRWAALLGAAAALLVLAGLAWWLGPGLFSGPAPPRQFAGSPAPAGARGAGDVPAAGDVAAPSDYMARSSLVVLGRVGRPVKVGGEPYVQIAVEKVLKGELEGEPFQVPDRLPTMYEDGPPYEPLTPKFPPGTRVILYLGPRLNERGKPRLMAAQVPTRPFLDVYEIAQGNQPMEKLPGILAAAAPYDQDVCVAVELFADERMASVLLDVFEDDVRARREAIQTGVTPKSNHCFGDLDLTWLLRRTLPAEEHPRLFDAIVDRVELITLDDAARKDPRLRHYHEANVLGNLPPSYEEFGEERRARLRSVLTRLIEGCTSFDRLGGMNRSLVQPLGRVADRRTVDFLLAEQARRPITRQHQDVAAGLAAALSVVEEPERREILDAWEEVLDELKSADDPRKENTRESLFTSEIVGGLGRAASPEALELLFEEHAKRPIAMRHVRCVGPMAYGATQLGRPAIGRVQRTWVESIREFRAPLSWAQRDYVVHVARLITAEPFSFGPDERAAFRAVLELISVEGFRTEVEAALRAASER